MDDPGLSTIAAVFLRHVATSTQNPSFDGTALLQLFILIVALILAGLASASETAFTSVSRVKLKNQVEEGDKRAAEIERMLGQPNSYLTTILIVNNVAVIVASTMATLLALRFTTSFSELISTIVISLVVLIFCEITPKTAAVQNPMRWARGLFPLVKGASWLLHPIVVVLGKVTNFVVRVLGGQVKRGPFVTEEELRLLVTVGEEEGVLEEEETEMINSIFEFADTTVREVMVPRIDMVTLESDATVSQAVDIAMEGGFSRIPVYEENIDNIIGVLYTKDMLKQLREGHESVPIRTLVRPAYFVPETKKLDDLLREIRQRRIHMVIVIDEYGSVAGLVTIEDLVEEIVGDIRDEYDREENLYEKVNPYEYIVDAKMSIDEFNELMETELENEDYDTLGGFLYAQLDKIPVPGDTITFDGLTFTVMDTRGRRITKVRVERHHDDTDANRSEPLLLHPPERAKQEKPDQTPPASPGQPDSHYEYRGA